MSEGDTLSSVALKAIASAQRRGRETFSRFCSEFNLLNCLVKDSTVPQNCQEIFEKVGKCCLKNKLSDGDPLFMENIGAGGKSAARPGASHGEAFGEILHRFSDGVHGFFRRSFDLFLLGHGLGHDDHGRRSAGHHAKAHAAEKAVIAHCRSASFQGRSYFAQNLRKIHC
jgi:hypothetical protein